MALTCISKALNVMSGRGNEAPFMPKIVSACLKNWLIFTTSIVCFKGQVIFSPRHGEVA